MSKLEDSLSLMARMDAMDKRSQEHRARIQKGHQNNKQLLINKAENDSHKLITEPYKPEEGGREHLDD